MKEQKKVKSSFYLLPDIDKEMRIEAAKLGLSYPSEFITMLWGKYKEKKKAGD